MDWIDEPGGEELWQEWEWLFEDVSSTIECLYSQFGGNETSDVMSLASALIDGVAGIHVAAGFLLLTTDPVIDIAHELDISTRLATEADLDDEDHSIDDERRDIGVVFAAVTEQAPKVCDLVDDAKRVVAGEVGLSGRPSLAALHALADATALLEGWSQIYVETAVGYHGVTGYLPDTSFGGGGLAEMCDWGRVQELRFEIASLIDR